MNHELVEKMLDAFGVWPFERVGITRDQLRANMNAVLHVAADAFEQALIDECECGQHSNTLGIGRCLADAVRARLLAPAKTPEERVTVEDGGEYPHTIWIVRRDGESVLHMLKSCYCRADAEIYRLGLIATLKQEGAE